MMRDNGCKVRCPACGTFVIRVTSVEAEAELNCPGSRCGVTLLVARDKNGITVNVVPKIVQKQQA